MSGMDQFGGVTGDEALRNVEANLSALRRALENPPASGSGMDDLVTWLRAQLDEDERVARQAAELAGQPGWWTHAEGTVMTDHGALMDGPQGVSLDDIGVHAARWDPARVLAEVEAKRRILDLTDFTAQFPDSQGGYDNACGDAIELLAQPYAGRDGWREEWSLPAST